VRLLLDDPRAEADGSGGTRQAGRYEASGEEGESDGSHTMPKRKDTRKARTRKPAVKRRKLRSPAPPPTATPPPAPQTTPHDDQPPDAPTGQPLTAARRSAFLKALRASGNVRLACQAADVGRRTAYHWREDAPFKADWDEALQDACDLLEKEARRRAVDGWDEPIFQKGGLVGTVRKYSDRMLELLLGAHRPERFRIGFKVQPDPGGLASAGPNAIALCESELPKSLYPQQLAFYRSQDTAYLFCAGVGAGKTFTGAVWGFAQSQRFPQARGFIGANTYLQLSKSTLPPFWSLLRRHKIDFVYGKAPPPAWGWISPFPDHGNVISMRNGAQILTYSLDNFNAMRGIEVGWAWVDETRDTDPEAFGVLLERLRGFEEVYPGHHYQIRVTTTPNGFDWLYDKFAGEDKAKRLPSSGFVTASSHDNPHNPPDYAQRIEAQLGRGLAKQQIYGQFVNLTTGRAYAFDRAKHIKPCAFQPRLPLVLGIDFNVSPLCAVVLQADPDGRYCWILDEIVIPDSAQTKDAAKEFARRYVKLRVGEGKQSRQPAVHFYGDASGRARDTRGSESDLDLIAEVLDAAFDDVTDDTPSSNPRVVDRVNAVNALLDPSKGSPRLQIDPKCKTLIRDLEQVAFKPGTRELDKGNGQLTHVSDALGYPITDLFPVTGTAASGYGEY
jgi:hypothetical protein